MGQTIITYLLDGVQYGPKIISIPNWSGKAIQCSRNNIVDVLKSREEVNSPGLYFLKSLADDERYSEKIYVGESENIKERIIQHLQDSNRDFEDCVAFISTNSMLTKSHVKYLESKSIYEMKRVNSVQLYNSNNSHTPRLPEYIMSDMDFFFEQMKIILPMVGYQCFQPTTSEGLEQKEKEKEQIVYYINSTKNDLKASLVKKEEGYIVIKGSQCRKECVKSLLPDRIKLRKQLIAKGVLVDRGRVYEFEKDTIFASTSQAASIILGAQTSGPKNWKDINGNTYEQNEAREINV